MDILKDIEKLLGESSLDDNERQNLESEASHGTDVEMANEPAGTKGITLSPSKDLKPNPSPSETSHGTNLDMAQELTGTEGLTSSPNKTLKPNQTKKRLNGAARKRLKHLLAQNVKAEEALKLCLKPIKDLPPEMRPVKRLRSEEASPKEHAHKTPKVAQHDASFCDTQAAKASKPSTPTVSTETKTPDRSIHKVPALPGRSSSPQVFTTTSSPTRQTTTTSQQSMAPASVQAAKTNRTSGSAKVGAATYKDVLGSFRVGIQHSAPMSDEMLGMVRSSVLREVGKITEAARGPRFVGCSFKPGWLLITCQNESSKKWLEETIPDLKPWPEAELSVLDEKSMPKPAIGTVFIPSTETSSVEEALRMMKSQNDELNSDLWKILNRKVEENGTTLTLSLDEPSVDSIKAHDYRVNLGFKKVLFRIKGTTKPEQQPSVARAGADASLAQTPSQPQVAKGDKNAKTAKGSFPRNRGASQASRPRFKQTRPGHGKGVKGPNCKPKGRPRPVGHAEGKP